MLQQLMHQNKENPEQVELHVQYDDEQMSKEEIQNHIKEYSHQDENKPQEGWQWLLCNEKSIYFIKGVLKENERNSTLL